MVVIGIFVFPPNVNTGKLASGQMSSSNSPMPLSPNCDELRRITPNSMARRSMPRPGWGLDDGKSYSESADGGVVVGVSKSKSATSLTSVSADENGNYECPCGNGRKCKGRSCSLCRHASDRRFRHTSCAAARAILGAVPEIGFLFLCSASVY